MLIEIHMLKNFAPTNLNRDDTGAPKTCLFGGAQRSRISSQCLKRSWRKSELFSQIVGEDNLGIRTRKLPELVGKRLREDGVPEELVTIAEKKVVELLKNDKKDKNEKSDKKEKENDKDKLITQIVFYSPEDIETVIEGVKKKLEECGDKKAFEKLSAKDLKAAVGGADKRGVTLDIALFGRMVTSDAFAGVPAAMQVAHAISTNRLTMEADFFTAMDDLISGERTDDLGAGMVGDLDFNSSCYYIYASLDTDKLAYNLKNDPEREALMAKAIPALLRVMAFSNPSGKQNTFAGHALPSAVLVECKDKLIPVSYANAFVKPVSPTSGKDLVSESITALAKEVAVMDADYALPVDKRLWFCSSKYDVPMGNAEKCAGFDALVTELEAQLRAE